MKVGRGLGQALAGDVVHSQLGLPQMVTVLNRLVNTGRASYPAGYYWSRNLPKKLSLSRVGATFMLGRRSRGGP